MKSAFKPDHIDFYKFYSWQFVSELIHWMKIYFPWSTVRALGTKPLGSHFPRVIFLWKEHVRLNFSVMEVQCFQLLQKILQLRNSYCTQKLLRFKRTYPSVLSITYKPTKHTKCTLYLIDTDQTTSFQFFFFFLKRRWYPEPAESYKAFEHEWGMPHAAKYEGLSPTPPPQSKLSEWQFFHKEGLCGMLSYMPKHNAH